MGRFRHHSDTRVNQQYTKAPARLADSSPYPFSSLIDPRFDQDSCGVGFVAQLSGEPSHEILERALTALARLEHRGAVAADGKSSDGVGVMTSIPRDLLLLPLGIEVIFLDHEDIASRNELSGALAAQQIEVLAWRPVPICPQILGPIAASTLPNIWQVLVTAAPESHADFDRRL